MEDFRMDKDLIITGEAEIDDILDSLIDCSANPVYIAAMALQEYRNKMEMLYSAVIMNRAEIPEELFRFLLRETNPNFMMSAAEQNEYWGLSEQKGK